MQISWKLVIPTNRSWKCQMLVSTLDSPLSSDVFNIEIVVNLLEIESKDFFQQQTLILIKGVHIQAIV